MGTDSTTDLVHAAAKGDEDAWNRLVGGHARLVWAVIHSHRLRPADSGDVFQTTWLRLVENLGSLRQPDQLAGWLVTTARRECLRLQRIRNREFPDPDLLERSDETDLAAQSPEATVLADEERAAVARAFQKLPHRCQSVLRLVYVDPPPTYAQIAELLGLAVGSIGITRRRCLDNLHRLLVDDDSTPAAEGRL